MIKIYHNSFCQKFFKKNTLTKGKISYNFLTDLINNNFFNDPIFLKIDIEEWEYRILINIIKFSNRLLGLVIEFYNADYHLDKILDFIKKINLELDGMLIDFKN